MKTSIIFIVAAVGALMALWIVMKPIMDDNKIRNKVLNFSEGMKNYYFLLEGSEAELLTALSGPMEQNVLDYSFQPDNGIIRFRRENVEADYRLDFCSAEGKSYLCVTRVAGEREKGTIPYLVNAFFIKNFRAKPVDYRKFEALFPEESEI